MAKLIGKLIPFILPSFGVINLCYLSYFLFKVIKQIYILCPEKVYWFISCSVSMVAIALLIFFKYFKVLKTEFFDK